MGIPKSIKAKISREEKRGLYINFINEMLNLNYNAKLVGFELAYIAYAIDHIYEAEEFTK